ncbi:metallophosphoesterase [Variovorax sp. ZS18.2.2]|uniref:metallophosphoesterase n=1 Tax=Variovorax sp. ZS18.2.2 TaxID=2971255 RepID=UPI00215114D7|nr:metallophosphoesterase [Variovorax sp. ZS18.2.2]MCR6480897.1 metallophosphoesterase [Variovorax sp. ZS18.2.2]
MTTDRKHVDGPQVLHFERNRQGRDFVVGDVHGCFGALQEALDAIGFMPECDRLFCTGDLVDRGRESHLVTAWLDQPWFASALGNHDLMAFEYALCEPSALSSSSLANHGGGWMLELPKAEQTRIGERLRALPLTIEIETEAGPVGLVHADFPFDDWRKVETLFSEDDRQICLWSTMRFDRVYRKAVANVRALVHGHLTLSTAQKLGNVHFIDTGGWLVGEGHFTFVELESLNLIKGPGPNASFGAPRNR